MRECFSCRIAFFLAMSDAKQVPFAINHCACDGLEMLGSTDNDALNHFLLDYFNSLDKEPDF